MTQQKDSVITDEMRAAIGRESEPVTHEVDNTGCRQFARAVGYTDAIFYDEAAARARGYRSVVAPAGFLGQPVTIPGKSAPRGPEALGFQTNLKRVLNGGTDFEYFADVCSGDILIATMKISDIAEREGRLGTMLVVSTETTYKNKAGKTVCIMRGGFIRY
jgi:hydroxyacyl-ACP dehydratase HTD2-like protein with hotdog domain